MHEYVGMKQGNMIKRTITSEYYCGRCGYPVSDHDSYCSECGGYLHGNDSDDFPSDAEYDEWYERAKHVEKDQLMDFIDEMLGKGKGGYTSLVHAVSACCIATMQACCNEMTGYQASWVPLKFLQHVNGAGTIAGFKILNYDNMMYPQYNDEFDIYVPAEVMDSLQKHAKRKLEEYADCPIEEKLVHPTVLKHWVKLASGEPPYGLEVR